MLCSFLRAFRGHRSSGGRTPRVPRPAWFADAETGVSYDLLGPLATRTDPLTHIETTVRDLLGSVTRRTDRNRQVTTYAYDPLNRRTFVGSSSSLRSPTP